MDSKKINIFLPFYKGISGGYKVVFEYANFLAENGHDVVIYYDLKDGKNSKHFPKILIRLYRKIVLMNYPYYFTLNSNIKQYGFRRYEKKYIRDADYSIVTAPITAYGVNSMNDNSVKTYFIQGYDNWENSEEYLLETYKYSMKKIVISNWLKDIVDKYSTQKAVVIRNGLDLEKFNIITKIEERNNYKISMVYRNGENKACKYGLKAIEQLKEKYNNIELNICGDKLPKEYLSKDWINFKQDAEEKDVIKMLNDSSIFVCTSIFEGFGLPGLEAMACGCALVTTDCMGPKEYANENNAIICKPKSEEAIYNSIEKYLVDNDFRIEKAKSGLETAKKWNIKNSKEEFLKELFK